MADGTGDNPELEAMDRLMTTSLPPQQILAAAAAATETSPSSNRQLSRQSSRESGASDASCAVRVNGSPAALEQLDQLGSRLEKFASSPPPQPDPKVASSPTPRKTSPGSMIPRPEISPKPAFLSSLAVSAKMSRMTQSMKSPGGGKAKSPPTAAGQATNGVADPK